MNRFFINSLLLAGLAGLVSPKAAAEEWAVALPGWQYEFPRDHHAHPDFKTEWWYFTGNLSGDDGREYGYQLTFFRQGVQRKAEPGTRFAVGDIKLAHFAVTEISGDVSIMRKRSRAGHSARRALPRATVWRGLTTGNFVCGRAAGLFCKRGMTRLPWN